jgi:triphosphoribosyl-dephospho-CoA synthase
MTSGSDTALTIGQCATLACLIEAMAPKPGNVHRGCDFEELSFADFCASAAAIGPAMEAAAHGERIGAAVLQAIQATRSLVATNTNLGTVLLLAPLARVPRAVPLTHGIDKVLKSLTPADASDVYAAIRHAEPGGMGKVAEADLTAEPPEDLLFAMQLAADRDLVARQYVDGFAIVLNEAAPAIAEGVARGWTILDAVVHAQLRLMSQHPDSLIARKCGLALAQQASDHAAEVLALGGPGNGDYEDALADFDFWLRSDGNARNPGTTADLLAAALFALLRDNRLPRPLPFYAV